MNKRLVLPTVASSIEWGKLKPLSSTREVANFLGVKEKTLRVWRSEASPLSPPSVCLGRAVYYERDALRRWYDRRILEQLRRQEGRASC